jgi:hypothetical protein
MGPIIDQNAEECKRILDSAAPSVHICSEFLNIIAEDHNFHHMLMGRILSVTQPIPVVLPELCDLKLLGLGVTVC